jgi:hypothetical protein
MEPVTDLYLQTIPNWRGYWCTASHYDPFTGKTTPLQIEDGTVTVDSAAACRRVLSMSVPPLPKFADALAAPGGEIAVTQTSRYIDQSTETIPVGVFVVDEDTLTYGRDGNLAVTGRDRSVTVQRAGFGFDGSASIPTNPTWAEVQRLVEGAWPNLAYPFPGWAQVDKTATTKVGPILWPDGDRGAAIGKLCTSSSRQFFFAPDGRAVFRKAPVPSPTSVPVWTVKSGDGGAMLGAERPRDRSQFFNVVAVDSSAVGLYLPRIIARNTNPDDPDSIYGPRGAREKRVTSPTFYTADQMTIAAIVKLMKLIGAASKLSLSSFINGALDADDVIGVVTPDGDPDAPVPYVIDSLTVPLLPTGVQQIQCRSILPTGYESILTDLGFS